MFDLFVEAGPPSRKVQSRGRSEQRGRWVFTVEVYAFWLDFTMGPFRINPDRVHIEIKSKHKKHVNFKLKKSTWSAALIDPAIGLWQARRGEAII